jgi:hypothetical protein
MPRAIDLGLERSWRQRLRRFERTGLSVRQFCRAEGVEEYTFFWWRRELAKRDRLRAAAQSSRRSPQRPAKAPPVHRRRVDGIPTSRSHPQRSHQSSAFVPVQVIAEPLAPACLEFCIGTSLVRVPITIDEPTLRQAIRVLHEETAAC